METGVRTCSATQPWLYGSRRTRDTDERLRHRPAPGPLVFLLLYEAARFLDESGQMSQTPLHSLLQDVVYALAHVICPFRASHVQFVAFDAG